MCGRFTHAYTWAEVHAFLDVIGQPEIYIHYTTARRRRRLTWRAE
jgi:hypothetical protein